MNQKLSLIGSIRGGLVFMGRHALLSALFFLLAYGAVYYAQKLSISTDLPVMFAYLVYTYFFYYFFVCFYFRRKPLFSRRRFGNALVRMLAILLLAFAALLALKIGFKILFFLAGTLKAFPEFYEQLRLAYLGLLVSPYFAWFLPVFMFIILSFTFLFRLLLDICSHRRRFFHYHDFCPRQGKLYPPDYHVSAHLRDAPADYSYFQGILCRSCRRSIRIDEPGTDCHLSESL